MTLATPSPRSGTAARVLSYAAVALAACGWGTWSLILRHAEAIGPMPAAYEATVVMAVITAFSGVLTLSDRRGARPTLRTASLVLCLGVTDALNVLLFFAAYKITVAVAVLSHYLTPVLVAVASPLLLGERLTLRTLVAVGCSLAGLGMMLANGEKGAAGIAAPGAVLLSAVLGAGSAVFYASNVIANKFVVDTLTTSEALFYHGLVATPLLAAFVPRAAWGAVDGRAALYLAAFALGPGALSALLFLLGLRRMPAAHASTLTLIEPLVAVLLGAAVFGEVLGVGALLGGGLIVGGALAVITQSTGARLTPSVTTSSGPTPSPTRADV